ncbi:MAG: biotin--[acetyl-CoA-carboxylase] ligase [Coriobacteriia bacterium]|nr:biotin--[acetyl-CoA-carboxylase] ligase [Coriobacteriia bacterium]
MTIGEEQELLAELNLVEYDEVDSTNDELRRILEGKGSGVGTPCVLALRQTKGRGRLGRAWESPPGGLYVSLALEVTDVVEKTAPLSLLVALAVRNELTRTKGDGSCVLVLSQDNTRTHEPSPFVLQVKWPNDIVCEQGKLCGILIELVQLQSKQQFAIIGVGINVTRPEKGASNRAAYLSDLCAATPNIRQTAKQVLAGILTYANRWKQASYDFAGFTKEYNSHLSLIDQEVTVSNSAGEAIAEGIVQGVDKSGQLLLQDEKGIIRKVSSGEVTLRR